MARVIAPPEIGKPLGLYSHGMIAPGGELVIVAGQVGLDGQGRLAGDDVGAQTTRALENVRAVVEAAGCTMGDVRPLPDLPASMEARQALFPGYFPDGAYPPNTLLIVAGLVRPEFRVEIEAMAVKPNEQSVAAGPSPRRRVSQFRSPVPSVR